MPPILRFTSIALALLAIPACSEPRGNGTGDRGDQPALARPAERSDTILLEGMPEPIDLRLFRLQDGPLPFSAYVPDDMVAEPDPGGHAVRFIAEFGGRRNPDAFLHFYVFPEGTGRETARAEAHAYVTSRGVPVSQGLEPVDAAELERTGWAVHAARFSYRSGGGRFLGGIGIGLRDGRFFQIVRHFPDEYGDGFGPRAALILDTWRWADGSPLR